MTSVIGGVVGRLRTLVGKVREARARTERQGEIDRELARIKSAMAGIEGRCREQLGVARSLIGDSGKARQFQLIPKLANAQSRARDFMAEVDYLRQLLGEVQQALYEAERAGDDTAKVLWGRPVNPPVGRAE